MIRKLLTRDRAVRSLPWVAVLFAGLGIVAALMYGKGSAYRIVSSTMEDPEDRFVHMGMLAVQWLLWGHLVVRLAERADPFCLALPFSARTLWLARLTASVLGLLVPALIAFAAFYLVNPAAADLPGLTQGLNFLVLLLALPFLVQARSTPARRADMPHPVVHTIAVGAFFVATQAVVAAARPPAFVVVPAVLLGIGLLFAFTWRSLPESFVLSGSLATGRRASLATKNRALAWLERIPVISPLSPLNRMLRLNGLVSLNLAGVLGGVLVYVAVTPVNDSYVQLYLLILFQVLFFWITLAGLPRVAHLPISSHRLFVQAVGPGIVVAGIALIIRISRDPGFHLGSTLGSRAVAVGVALYLLGWAVVTALLLLRYLPAPATNRTRVARVAATVALALLGLVTVAGALFPMLGDEVRQAALARRWLDGLGHGLPVAPGLAWPILGALTAGLYLALHALFTRIETTKLLKGMSKWSAVDS